MSLRTATDFLFDRITRRLDTPLMVATVVLAAISLTVVYSASGGVTFDRMLGQLRNFLVAFIALWVIANISPQTLMRLAIPVYIVGLFLLVGVALFGDVKNNARRWLSLGFATIQPSEIMKIGVPLLLAWYFHRREEGLTIRDYAIAGLFLMLPVGLIVRQPDLGTAILVFASGFFVIFFAGLSWKVIISAVIGVSAAMPFIFDRLHGYQKNRILTLFDPMQDPQGAGYHIIQSTIALGSGGVLGKGWLNGSQAQLDFIPERSTDFILAVFGEEFGLIGNLLLMTLYLIIIGRGLMISMNASTTFSRLLASSITLTFFTYAFVNIGMVSGILPVVGVPLPLMSYGGTSILSMCVGFGVLMSISTHKQLVST